MCTAVGSTSPDGGTGSADTVVVMSPRLLRPSFGRVDVDIDVAIEGTSRGCFDVVEGSSLSVSSDFSPSLSSSGSDSWSNRSEWRAT